MKQATHLSSSHPPPPTVIILNCLVLALVARVCDGFFILLYSSSKYPSFYPPSPHDYHAVQLALTVLMSRGGLDWLELNIKVEQV